MPVHHLQGGRLLGHQLAVDIDHRLGREQQERRGHNGGARAARARRVEAELDALAAARSEDPEKGGLAGYLQRQLGARSVTPREGDDADAVLSRVESAVQNGDIPKAMELIATLPEVAQAEMADWLILAQTRVDVLAALDGLLPSNGSN